jgi:uncharacterized protein
MLVPTWGSRWVRFVVSHRVLILSALLGLLGLGLWHAQRVSLSAKMTDYYPSQHPHVRLYREFGEMLKMANAVVMTVTVKDGSIYTSEALGKIHRLTVDLIETRGVNPNDILSLTHPRLKDIRISSENIEILPVVNAPEQPQTPDALARIKNAVYTNVGIRGVYVSPDDKTALIRAGFWDDLVEPQAIFERLLTIAERERDANTEIHFTGNLVLAAWLRDSASRIVLLLFASGVLALIFCGQSLGSFQAFFLALLVNAVAASLALGFLGASGLALEPLMLFVFFPLGIRGLSLVISWYRHLTHIYRTVGAPFADQESRLAALEQTAVQVYCPLTIALSIDALALLSLVMSDVLALRSLAVLGAGWSVGLLLALWLLVPLWSWLFRFPSAATLQPLRMERLVTRLTHGLRRAVPASSLLPLGLLLLAGFGIVAAAQLRAGREVMGSTLFYSTHPYNQAFALVNEKFIGVNQLIVVAQATDQAAFRSPRALQTIEAFQQHMAEDQDFGGSVAITNLVKSVTRMFHEDIPKWEVIPDDLDSAGQVIFRVVSSAATPSEVARLFSQDFRATAVSFFYRQYSPDAVTRIFDRARSFTAAGNNHNVQFHIGGGLLGILAAMHGAVEQNYWRFFAVFGALTALGALLATKSVRAMLEIVATVLLTQAALLLLLWWGGIDLNMYSLPILVTGFGMLLPATFPLWTTAAEENTAFHVLMVTGVITAVAAAVWLLSPLRLQAELGVLLLVLAFVGSVLPWSIKQAFLTKSSPD